MGSRVSALSGWASGGVGLSPSGDQLLWPPVAGQQQATAQAVQECLRLQAQRFQDVLRPEFPAVDALTRAFGADLGGSSSTPAHREHLQPPAAVRSSSSNGPTGSARRSRTGKRRRTDGTPAASAEGHNPFTRAERQLGAGASTGVSVEAAAQDAGVVENSRFERTLAGMEAKQLRKRLRKLKLPDRGTTAELQLRLRLHHQAERAINQFSV